MPYTSYKSNDLIFKMVFSHLYVIHDVFKTVCRNNELGENQEIF